MNKVVLWNWIFLAVGVLTVLEFVFVRGMFTWLLMVAAVVVVGMINVVLCMSERKVLQALNFLLCMTALCMGYLTLA